MVPHPDQEILPWQRVPWLKGRITGLKNVSLGGDLNPEEFWAEVKSRLHTSK